MSQAQYSCAICTVKPDRRATEPRMVAPCRTRRTAGKVVSVASAIAAFGCPECTGRDFVARHIARLARSRRSADHRLRLWRRAKRHWVIAVDMSTACTALSRRWKRIAGRALEHPPAVVVVLCRVGAHTVVAMDHAVPCQKDEASRNLSALPRTPSAVPKANVVASGRASPALRSESINMTV